MNAGPSRCRQAANTSCYPTWKSSKDLPDVHTPAMIINSLMFGFTVQVMVSQDPINLARVDYIWANYLKVSYGPGTIPNVGYTAVLSEAIVYTGSKVAGQTVATLLLSLFTVLIRYTVEAWRLDEEKRGNNFIACFVACDWFAAIAVVILTMVSLGFFLALITYSAIAVMPQYRQDVRGQNALDLLRHIQNLTSFENREETDPFGLLESPNGPGSYSMLGQRLMDWLNFNSFMYIALGATLAFVAIVMPVLVTLWLWRSRKTWDESVAQEDKSG